MVCIHWYCPWIRTVFRKNDEWSEVICDLSAIGYVGSAKRYFTTIFEMSQKSQGIKAYRAACLFESHCNDRDILWNECNQYFGCK